MRIKSIRRQYQLAWETEPNWACVQLSAPTGNDVEELKLWIRQNTEGDITVFRPQELADFSRIDFYFQRPDEAVIFKLMFAHLTI